MKITLEDDMITYALKEEHSFAEKPLGQVDSVILSWFSYLRMPPELIPQTWGEGLPVRDLLKYEWFEGMTERTLCKEESLELLFAICAGVRFRDLKIRDYSEECNPEVDQQFAALTFELPTGEHYVAFRGTDSTLVGWREDFNMVLQYPIPSQKKAKAYLNRIGRVYSGPLMTGGHSKGGNLAVYASAECDEDIQDRIQMIFSHDGPGFLNPEAMERLPRIRDRINKTLPQSSLIGLLFEQEADYEVIRSTGKGFGQHNPFTWPVINGEFIREDRIKRTSNFLDGTVTAWLAKLELDERQRVIDNVFDVIASTGEDNFLAVGVNMKENLRTMAGAAWEKDEQTKKFFLHVLRVLASSGARVGSERVRDKLFPEPLSLSTEMLHDGDDREMVQWFEKISRILRREDEKVSNGEDHSEKVDSTEEM